MPKSGGTVFIQPHSDDSVMSSYSLIKEGILPRPYCLLTVFGQSNWIDLVKKRSPRYVQSKDQIAVTRIRRTEDEEFAKSFNLTLLFLNFEDCLLKNKKVFYQPNKRLDADLVRRVSMAIRASIRKYSAKNVVAPFPCSVKQHYDHRVVSEAVKSLLTTLCNRFFVDDIPYSRITDQYRHGLRPFARLKIDDMRGKFHAMEIYDSQMCKLFFDQTRKIARQNQGYERVFTFTKR